MMNRSRFFWIELRSPVIFVCGCPRPHSHRQTNTPSHKDIAVAWWVNCGRAAIVSSNLFCWQADEWTHWMRKTGTTTHWQISFWSIKYTIVPIVSFNTVKRDQQWHTDKETIRPPHIKRNWLMGWMIHNSMCLFVLPADELVGMSYFNKCLLLCSWGPQGVGLCQTQMPLSRGMGSFSGGSLSMADTPTQYIYDSDWYASYQNSLLF